MKQRNRLLVAGFLLTLTGCGKGEVMGLGNRSDPTGQDATSDTGTTDLGVYVPDTGGLDVYLGDNEVPDNGLHPDAFVPDAFVPDVVFPDIGPTTDIGFIDVNFPDGGSRPDAYVPDTGAHPDTGPDAGVHPDATVFPDAGGPECLIDDDCSGREDHCEPTSHTCVECYDPTHCRTGQVCDTAGGFVCRQECWNGQCGPFGVCDTTINACVECLTNQDCDPGEVCYPALKECVECYDNAHCVLQPGSPVCDMEDYECVPCMFDTDCPPGEQCMGDFCAPPTGRALCVPCEDDAECGGPADLCIGYISSGSFFDRACSIDCSMSTNACPSGYECIEVRSGAAHQCRPSYDMQTPTCVGTRNLGEPCNYDPNDVDPGCGIRGVQDARCIADPTGTFGTCVVWCDNQQDCISGFTCTPTGSNVSICL